MTKDQAIIGTRVRSLVEFAGVPQGTEGVIDEEYHLDVSGEPGYMVAWDLPHHPLPPGYKEHTGEPTIKTGILRDGFSLRELEYLEVTRPEVVPPSQPGGA